MSTYQPRTVEGRDVRQVDDKIAYIDPTVAPLITILNRIKGKREACYSVKPEWLEKDYVARWAIATAAVTAVASSTTVAVDDGTKFVAGDVFAVAPPIGTFARHEVIRVVSVSANNLTVVRNVGGSHLAAIPLSGDLRIIGKMMEEFSTFPDQKRAVASPKFTYLQIDRTGTAFSNTAEALKVYGNSGKSDRDQAHIEDMIHHKEKMNATLIWGRVSEDATGGPTGYPIRSTMGLIDTIRTNVLDAGGMLTFKRFQEWCRMLSRYGARNKVLIASDLICDAVDGWGHSKLQLKPGDSTLGLNISTVVCGGITLSMVRDKMLENGTSGLYGWGNIGICLDLDNIWYLYLNNNGVNRDTHVVMDAVKDGKDGKRDEICTEYGYKIKLEKTHGILTGVTDYQL